MEEVGCNRTPMAIETRKGKKGTSYRVSWTNPVTGDRECKTFHDKLEAKEFNNQILRRLRDDPGSFGAVTPDSPTFEYLADAYFKRAGLSPSTASSTFYTLQKKILPHIGAIEVKNITKRILMGMEEVWRAKGNKQPTLNRQMSVVKAVLNWAEDQELIEANPVPRYVCKRGATARIPPPSPTELDALYACAPEHVRRAIILGAGTGARVGKSELLRIRWEDVRWKERTLLVWSADKNLDLPYREVPLSAGLLEALELWRTQDPIQVETIIHAKGKPISSFKTAWKSTKKRAGIERRIRPYDLRHYFATRALLAGADLKATAASMGHANETMILKTYQHVLPSLQRMAVSKVELPTRKMGEFLGEPAPQKAILATHESEKVKQ